MFQTSEHLHMPTLLSNTIYSSQTQGLTYWPAQKPNQVKIIMSNFVFSTNVATSTKQKYTRQQIVPRKMYDILNSYTVNLQTPLKRETFARRHFNKMLQKTLMNAA